MTDDWLLRNAIFDRVGEVYADDVVAIVRDWLATYERPGCTLGDAQAELEADPFASVAHEHHPGCDRDRCDPECRYR